MTEVVAIGAIYRVRFEHGGASLHVERDVADIVDLYVEALWRGQGYGVEYINELLVIAREKGAKRIVAHVRPDNLPSHRAFSRIGFTVTSQEDHMELEL